MKKFSHIDSKGEIKMVDVSPKQKTLRTAEAYAEVKVTKKIINLIKKNELQKGDALVTAKIAGIQAAKKTFELIPLCHNIFISGIDLNIKINSKLSRLEISSQVKTNAETGVEMEALTAVTVAALTIYDMIKGIDKSSVISNIRLLSKTGGKSGGYIRRKDG